MTSSTRPGWSLWRDWCTATGHAVDDVSDHRIAQFTDEVHVGHRALAGIRTTARERGLLTAAPVPVDPWVEAEKLFDPLDACLRDCARTGWPLAYTGRRDAFALVLTRGLRLTRDQALGLGPAGIDLQEWAVGTRPLAFDDDPRCCPRCVVVRWLACCVADDRWNRSGVRELLWQPSGRSGHDCRRPAPADLPSWAVLLPAIDRYGWVSTRAMSPRALTVVLAARCLAGVPRPEPDEHAVERWVPAGDSASAFDETTLDRLDAACDRADEVNARVARILGDMDVRRR